MCSVQCAGGFVCGHEFGYSLPCVIVQLRYMHAHVCVFVSVCAHAYTGVK